MKRAISLAIFGLLGFVGGNLAAQTAIEHGTVLGAEQRDHVIDQAKILDEITLQMQDLADLAIKPPMSGICSSKSSMMMRPDLVP